MNFLVKYEFFRKVRKFCTLLKNSNFTEIFILFDFYTLPKNSYFTKKFILDGKFRTPDVQVLCFLRFLAGLMIEIRGTVFAGKYYTAAIYLT